MSQKIAKVLRQEFEASRQGGGKNGEREGKVQKMSEERHKPVKHRQLSGARGNMPLSSQEKRMTFLIKKRKIAGGRTWKPAAQFIALRSDAGMTVNGERKGRGGGG